jgi:hypothetical protein
MTAIAVTALWIAALTLVGVALARETGRGGK